MQQIKAPVAKKQDHWLEAHNDRRNDPYYWLRDDTRQDPQVLDYLKQENNYTERNMVHTKGLQKTLFEEMTERLEPNEETVPALEKGYWYWSKFEADKEYRIHLRKKDIPNAKQQVILDQNQRAKNHDFYQLASLEISPNQQLMAIAEDNVSRRKYQVRIQDLSSGKFFDEVIKQTSGNIVWANDNKTLFYVKKHKTTLLPYQVYRHKLGSDPATDVLVYEEKDDTFYTAIFKTRSEKFIGIDISSTMNSEVRLIDADHPDSAIKIFLPREKDHKYSVDHIGDYFYATSDLNAPNEKMVKVATDKIGDKQHWQQIIAHNTDNLLQDFLLFNDFLVVNERTRGVERITIRDHSGKLLDEIQFKDAAYSAGIGNNPDPKAQKIRYSYTSMTTPYSQFEYNREDKSSSLLKQDKILGGFDSSNYHSERLMIDARDGSKVPVSLVYRKDKFTKNGNNPMLQYAYGSYGYTVDAGFSISRISLLDRGFVYAIAHIRGGQMLGRQWYEDGKKLHKMNTFTDFIDVTKSLVAQGYADKNRVYAMGGSAGGLLMGAVINMAPDLYHGVIAAVPFVDVVTTMQDESIPLTTGEYDEWGNPADEAYYRYMLSYSPYDQVTTQDYPNLLVTTGLHDSQVQYWEPAKWVAKLRASKTDSNILLLDIDMTAGHGGKSGRYKAYEDIAKEFAFILDLNGINQ
ncbi:MAG: S9 family peptidase [Enterobacterales bacterium]|nr:S9 family peptidase [Enterobacterales bacterium]